MKTDNEMLIKLQQKLLRQNKKTLTFVIIGIVAVALFLVLMLGPEKKAGGHDYELLQKNYLQLSDEVKRVGIKDFEIFAERLKTCESTVEILTRRMERLEKQRLLDIEVAEIFHWKDYYDIRPQETDGEVKAIKTLGGEEKTLELLVVYTNREYGINRFLIDKNKFEEHDEYVVAWANIPPYYNTVEED